MWLMLDLSLLKINLNKQKYLHRFIWIIVHILGAGAIAFMLVNAYYFYLTNPMVTTLYDTLYPIKEISFPAVAVCSNNRISYAGAVAFSKQL